MHRGGYGPHCWIEVSAELTWQRRGRSQLGLNELILIGPAVKGQWHEFVTPHIVSMDPALGEITVWEKLASEPGWTTAIELAGATAVPNDIHSFGSFPADTMSSVELAGGDWSGDGSVYYVHLDEVRVGGPENAPTRP